MTIRCQYRWLGEGYLRECEYHRRGRITGFGKFL